MQGQVGIVVQVVLWVGADVVGEACDEQGMVEVGGGGGVDGLHRSARRRTATRLLSAEALVTHRVVDHAQAQLASFGIGDRDRVDGDAMDVVDRAVQRVDIPDMVSSAGELAALLSHDAVTGKCWWM